MDAAVDPLAVHGIKLSICKEILSSLKFPRALEAK